MFTAKRYEIEESTLAFFSSHNIPVMNLEMMFSGKTDQKKHEWEGRESGRDRWTEG